MKKILVQLDSDPFASVFDAITAYDAGVDHVLHYGGVAPEAVRDLVYGAMFTRGGDDLKNSAVFIGGSDVATGEAMLEAATEAFFGPVRVSVMMDANGCNTTAAAAVAKMLSVGDVKGKKVVVLAGTGPVGLRAAAFFAKEGAQVTITSRALTRAEAACASIQERFGVEVEYNLDRALEGADVVMMLRIQLERQQKNLFPSIREYRNLFSLSPKRFRRARKNAIIMHPGPINRGVEISADLADSVKSVILKQVENGIAVRMAVLYLLIGGKEREITD